MEFVSKDADMVLVKTTPEELKKLAAIIRAVHGWDFVMCEMDPDDAIALAERMERATEESWVFHELEVFYIRLMLGTAFHGIPLDRVNYFSPVTFKDEEIEDLMKSVGNVVDLAREA